MKWSLACISVLLSHVKCLPSWPFQYWKQKEVWKRSCPSFQSPNWRYEYLITFRATHIYNWMCSFSVPKPFIPRFFGFQKTSVKIFLICLLLGDMKFWMTALYICMWLVVHKANKKYDTYDVLVPVLLHKNGLNLLSFTIFSSPFSPRRVLLWDLQHMCTRWIWSSISELSDAVYSIWIFAQLGYFRPYC